MIITMIIAYRYNYKITKLMELNLRKWKLKLKK